MPLNRPVHHTESLGLKVPKELMEQIVSAAHGTNESVATWVRRVIAEKLSSDPVTGLPWAELEDA